MQNNNERKKRVEVNLLVCKLPLGLAPSIAKLTLALRPSMMGLGSLHALSAAALSPMITYEQNRLIQHV